MTSSDHGKRQRAQPVTTTWAGSRPQWLHGGFFLIQHVNLEQLGQAGTNSVRPSMVAPRTPHDHPAHGQPPPSTAWSTTARRPALGWYHSLDDGAASVWSGADGEFAGEVAADPQSATAAFTGERVRWRRACCRVCDAGALVADLAVEGVVVMPEEQATSAAPVADGVGGEFSGDNDQSLDLVVLGAEPAGVRSYGLAQHMEAVDVEGLVDVNGVGP